MMFSSSEYPMALDEATFDTWLEKGRESKLSYTHLLIVWDALDAQYMPVYIAYRSEIASYEVYGQATGREALVAVYDLYSEARISL